MRLHWLVLAAGLLSAAPCSAALIWDNGAPLEGSLGVNISAFAVADQFALSAPSTLMSVTAWARTNDGGQSFPATFSGTVGWAIYSDASLAPGALLASGSDASPTVTATGLIGEQGAEIYQLDAQIATALLPAGDYWLALRAAAWGAPDPAGGDPFGWIFWQYTAGITGAPLLADADLANPITWDLTTGRDPAFRIEGEVIPEPATVFLVGAALLLITRWRRSGTQKGGGI